MKAILEEVVCGRCVRRYPTEKGGEYVEYSTDLAPQLVRHGYM